MFSAFTIVAQKSGFVETFVFFDFHQDNIFTDLADTFPGDDKLAVTAQETADPTGSRDNQGQYLPGFAVEIDINGTAQTFTGTGINDFFLLQLTKTHTYTGLFFYFMLAGRKKCRHPKRKSGICQERKIRSSTVC